MAEFDRSAGERAVYGWSECSLSSAEAPAGREHPRIVLYYLMAAMATFSLTCYSESNTGAWLIFGEGVC